MPSTRIKMRLMTSNVASVISTFSCIVSHATISGKGKDPKKWSVSPLTIVAHAALEEERIRGEVSPRYRVMRDRRNSRNSAGVALLLEELKPGTGNGVEVGTLITSNLHAASKRSSLADHMTRTRLIIYLFYI